MKKVLLSSILIFIALTIGHTSQAAGPVISVSKPDWGVQCWTPHPYLPGGYCQHWYHVTQQGIPNAVAQCESTPGAYVGVITPL